MTSAWASSCRGAGDEGGKRKIATQDSSGAMRWQHDAVPERGSVSTKRAVATAEALPSPRPTVTASEPGKWLDLLLPEADSVVETAEPAQPLEPADVDVLLSEARHEDRRQGRFGGNRVNVVQIGLGTFGTFVQNLAGDEWDENITWLLAAVSERAPARLTGVAVEPVPEHLERLRAPACRLPGMALAQVAIGEDDAEAELHLLSSTTYQTLLGSVPTWQRNKLEAELLYVRNMSCVGREHPALAKLNERFSSSYGFKVPVESLQIEVWSYGRLARELDFCGCEVLLVDAEGSDTKILRSMIAHCEAEERRQVDAWPDVVQFETMGHCDREEGVGAEADMVKRLKRCGYLLVYWSYYNTILVNNRAMKSEDKENRSQRLKAWIRDTVRCQVKGCGRRGNANGQGLPFTSHEGKVHCWHCYKWKNGLKGKSEA